MVGLGYVVGNAVSARYSRRVGIDGIVFWGCLLSLLAVLCIAVLLAGQWTLWAIFGPGTVAAFASGLVMPNAQAGAMNVDSRPAGTASGLMGFLQLLVGAAMAQVVGSAIDETPYPMVIAMAAMASLALLAISLRKVVVPAQAVRR